MTRFATPSYSDTVSGNQGQFGFPGINLNNFATGQNIAANNNPVVNTGSANNQGGISNFNIPSIENYQIPSLTNTSGIYQNSLTPTAPLPESANSAGLFGGGSALDFLNQDLNAGISNNIQPPTTQALTLSPGEQLQATGYEIPSFADSTFNPNATESFNSANVVDFGGGNVIGSSNNVPAGIANNPEYQQFIQNNPEGNLVDFAFGTGNGASTANTGIAANAGGEGGGGFLDSFTNFSDAESTEQSLGNINSGLQAVGALAGLYYGIKGYKDNKKLAKEGLRLAKQDRRASIAAYNQGINARNEQQRRSGSSYRFDTFTA